MIEDLLIISSRELCALRGLDRTVRTSWCKFLEQMLGRSAAGMGAGCWKKKLRAAGNFLQLYRPSPLDFAAFMARSGSTPTRDRNRRPSFDNPPRRRRRPPGALCAQPRRAGPPRSARQAALSPLPARPSYPFSW